MLVTTASPNDATSLLAQSIAAMGGAAWQNIGAVTARVSVTTPDRATPTEGKWSDDWTAGQVYSRREWTGEHGSFVRLTNDKQAATYVASAAAKIASPDYDLVNIAPILPAVALRLALSREDCSFHRDQASNSSQQAVVSQSCQAQFYPNKQVLLKWTINTLSAMPVSVEIPVRGRDGSVVFQIAKFQLFESAGGVRYPTRVEIDWTMAHSPRTLVFTDMQFHTALDKTEFAIH